MTFEGERATEIRTRIAMAKSTSNLINIWKSKEINIATKVRLAKSLVWSVTLYGSESWALKKENERRLLAFELWLWRRVLIIS